MKPLSLTLPVLALALSATAQSGEDSRIAVFAQESAVTRDLTRALAALSEITAQCEACHTSYRLK